MAPTGINRPGYSSSPTGINRPGYSSPKSPTGVNRPGTSSPSFSGYSRPDRDDGPNIVLKPKPPVPQMSTYDAGKKAYADFLRSNMGQSGGISSIPTQSRVQSYMQQDPYGPANIRQQYFDNRPIPTERLQRRGMQDKLVDQFKAQYTKPVVGSSNLLQMTADAPMSLSDYRNQVAFEYGPTLKEIMGDAGYALSSIGKGLAEKGTPMMQLAKSLFGGVQNLFTGASQAPTTVPMSSANMMQTSMPMNNLTEFGQMLANRIRADRPGISDAELLQVLQRSNDAGFATQGRPVFKTGMFANGGIATLS